MRALRSLLVAERPRAQRLRWRNAGRRACNPLADYYSCRIGRNIKRALGALRAANAGKLMSRRCVVCEMSFRLIWVIHICSAPCERACSAPPTPHGWDKPAIIFKAPAWYTPWRRGVKVSKFPRNRIVLFNAINPDYSLLHRCENNVVYRVLYRVSFQSGILWQIFSRPSTNT